MRKYRIEVLAAFGDDGREADDFRARADYDEEFQFAIVGKPDSAVICSYLLGHNYLFYRVEIRVRAVGIEDFIAVHHRNQILCF